MRETKIFKICSLGTVPQHRHSLALIFLGARGVLLELPVFGTLHKLLSLSPSGFFSALVISEAFYPVFYVTHHYASIVFNKRHTIYATQNMTLGAHLPEVLPCRFCTHACSLSNDINTPIASIRWPHLPKKPTTLP